MRLGEARVLANRLADALGCAGRALTFARESGQRGDEARALCLLGNVTARRNRLDHAERHYREALALAEERGMRLARPTATRPRQALPGIGSEHVATATTIPRHGHDTG
jgi:tetratricopeptide (TPR) repeat protein